MKLHYIILSLALGQNFLHAQVETVTPASAPMGIAFYGNDLYVTEHTIQRVSKVDVTQSNPQLIDYLTGDLIVPHDVAVHGSYLYISDYFEDKIFKIDVTDLSATPILVVDFINSPMGLAFHGDELFISTMNSIWKVNVTDTSPTAVQVISGLQGPPKITFKGNELYIAEPEQDKISKLDVTQNPATLIDVLVGVNAVSSVKFKGDDLYFTRLYNDAIWKIDITDQNPIPVIVAAGVAGASALAFLNDELYIAERATNRISKISTSLSVLQDSALPDLQLFPNPATSSITVSGLPGEGVLTLFSIAGARFHHQLVREYDQVNVALPTGIYIAKIECGGASVIKKLIIK